MREGIDTILDGTKTVPRHMLREHLGSEAEGQPQGTQKQREVGLQTR